MAALSQASHRPSAPPPTSALPPLPNVSKTRKSLPTGRLSSLSQRSRLSTARMSSASLPRPPRSPGPSDRFQRSSTPVGNAIPAKTVRRTISLAAFPQPPKGGSRIASPSPLMPSASDTERKRVSSDSTISLNRRKAPRSIYATNAKRDSSSRPSLMTTKLNSKSFIASPLPHESDSLLSPPSPTQSRSSSALGSDPTSATSFEDTDDSTIRGKETSDDVLDDEKGSKSKENKGNVIVSVRVRPDAGGNDGTSDGEWMVDGRRCLIGYRGKEGGDYFYDNVFAAHDNNAKVYDSCAKRLVRRVMEGYHGTVFAYGMTGTGKTFSMQGTASNPGVIPLAITDIFSYIRETPNREFLLRVSYLEIYNEKIYDLLSASVSAGAGPASQQQQEEIKIREDSKRGVYATPLKEEIVQSPTQLLRVIARGDHARRVAGTEFNSRSSRSHAVVQIVVESRQRVSSRGGQENKRSGLVPGGVRVSTLSLIDLAGSERAAENKERRAEGAHINKSLLTLGTVIARLSTKKDKNGNPMDKEGKHLPYRDSKLTRLLQPALSGDSLVSILCTIQIGSAGSSARSNHTNETLNTLKFALRARNNLVSHAKKAEDSSGGAGDAGSRALLERYRQEIQTLRKQLEEQAKLNAAAPSSATLEEEKEYEKAAEQRHEEQLLEMQLARTALKERIEHLQKLIISSQSTGVNSARCFSSMSLSRRTSGTRSVRSSLTPSIIESLAPPSAPASLPPTSSNQTSSLGVETPDEDECESAIGDFADGTASLQAQNRALQADIVDKNRYIAALEKRLLQAQRTSHSKAGAGFRSASGSSDESVAAQLQERDDEIASLRAQLDDKDRMVIALRSAARKRDIAESVTSSSPSSPIFPRRERGRPLSNHTSAPRNSTPHSMGPVGPFELLSPTISIQESRDSKKNVDEMSRMLDEMIRERVEGGQLIRSKTDSIRLADPKRDTIMSTVSIPALNTHAHPFSPLPEVMDGKHDSGVMIEAQASS